MRKLTEDEAIFIIAQRPQHKTIFAFNPKTLEDTQKCEIVERMLYNLNLMQLEEVEHFAKSTKKNYIEILPNE